MANNNNNKEQLSIAQVFGEKSKDADEWADAKKIMLERLLSAPYKSDFTYEPREIRRRESEYPLGYDEEGESWYSPLYEDEFKSLKKYYGTEQFEGDPIDFIREKEGGGTYHQGWSDEAKEVYDILDSFSPYGGSAGNSPYSGNPVIAHDKYIEQELDWEKPEYAQENFPYKIPRYREDVMQPMEKGKGLMSLLQRLIPGGKTGMK